MPHGRDNLGASIKSQQTTKRYNPNLPVAVCQDPGKGKVWRFFCRLLTCCVPSVLICRPDKASKLAWREKVAIFDIFLFFNAIFLFIFGALPFYFCRFEENFLSDYDWYDAIIDETCLAVGYASYVLIFTVAGLLGLQCICSMIVGLKSFCFRVGEKLPIHPKNFKNHVMIMVPCYNEGNRELSKTISSVLDSDYSDESKVLFVVADGIITGKGEFLSTPATLSKLLGFSLNSSTDKSYSYESLGGGGENRASVYSGVHQHPTNGKYLKYVVVIKRGTSAEKNSSKPGNRGKRDSQLIALGLLNRFHHGRRPSDLDKALYDSFAKLGVPVGTLQYMLAIDADTRISVGSIAHMVYSMNKKPKVLACCGETRVDNKFQSWVTYIQIYEYFASHHLKKSFESIFGVVTCLPGCFTMYRIVTDDQRALIASDAIFQSYARNDIESLHEKNLYLLGEDRMLTTLLLKHFADMSLSFVPIACCWTMVPDTFKVLLSQRRRWINSTFHNMWQLMKISIQCGFCCLSMNVIVILDMTFFMILPSGLIYAILYTYTVIADGESINTVTISLYVALIGFQMIIFLVRSRIDYILWFLIYLVLGIPVFYFVLPIYSFWNMDDFSWGTTRQVAGGVDKSKSTTNADVSIAGYGAGDEILEEDEDTHSLNSEHSQVEDKFSDDIYLQAPPPLVVTRAAPARKSSRSSTQSSIKSHSQHSSSTKSDTGPVNIYLVDESDHIEASIPTEVLADAFGDDFTLEESHERGIPANTNSSTRQARNVGRNVSSSKRPARESTSRLDSRCHV